MIITSLELSKQLKEAGFPQEAEFYYLDDGYGYRYQFNEVSFAALGLELNDKVVFTFSAEEILERLPEAISFKKDVYWLSICKDDSKNLGWEISYSPPADRSLALQTGKSLAEAAGEMWLYLNKEGLLKEANQDSSKQD